MTNHKKTSLLIIVCVCLLVISVLILFCRAVNQAGLPMHETDLTADIQTFTEQAELFLGTERTDAVVCYQDPETQELMLLNLTYQQFENQMEIYPAELLESSGILPGDFAEITYTADYSSEHFLLRDLKDWQQLTPSQALTQAVPALNQSHSSDFPIQIWQSQEICYLMIPAGDCYDLFRSDSDKAVKFDEYRCVTQELEMNGNIEILSNWILCSQNFSNEEIQDRLYHGTVTETSNLFLVGYENQELFLNMQNSILTVESEEVRNWHLSAKQLEIPEIMADLPEAVRQDLERNWNHTDDVLVFAGNLTEDTHPGFDQNHRLIPVKGTGEPAGYVVWYVPAVFFEKICSEIAE